jgi:hypothetical protein
MGFKVRPFETFIERSQGNSAIKVCGSISDGLLLFSVAGASWPIPTITCTTDDRGPYSIIGPQEIPLGNGFVIRVQERFDVPEDDPASDSEIALLKPGDVRSLEATVREQGLKPKQFNPLVPPDAYISVSFDSRGRVNGGGCMEAAQSFDELLSSASNRVLN